MYKLLSDNSTSLYMMSIQNNPVSEGPARGKVAVRWSFYGTRSIISCSNNALTAVVCCNIWKPSSVPVCIKYWATWALSLWFHSVLVRQRFLFWSVWPCGSQGLIVGSAADVPVLWMQACSLAPCYGSYTHIYIYILYIFFSPNIASSVFQGLKTSLSHWICLCCFWGVDF